MNNSINSVNNVPFKSRYLNIVNRDEMPQIISDAIYKNDAIDKFIHSGKPKTLLGKIIDLFIKDKALDVRYVVSKIKISDSKQSKRNLIDRMRDPYQKVVSLIFEYNQRSDIKKIYELSAEQSGIKRSAGSIPKPGEHYAYKMPVESAEEKLAKKIEELDDLKNLLK